MDRYTQQLISDIEKEVQITRNMTGKDHLDPRVMAAIANVPRELFLPSHQRYRAFYNEPVPIGFGQTISQPYIVALMTDLLAIQAESTILEIGTGSGYQSAILSQLCAAVYSVEIIPELEKLARDLFKKLNVDNVKTIVGNGYLGWPEHSPYDGIIVTAAAPQVPPDLIEQLKPGGRLIIPVGMSGMHQELLMIEKDERDHLTTTPVIGVAFVPLVHDYSV